jgi:hypothetical protein
VGLVVNLGEFSQVQMGVTFSCVETRVMMKHTTTRDAVIAGLRLVKKSAIGVLRNLRSMTPIAAPAERVGSADLSSKVRMLND